MLRAIKIDRRYVKAYLAVGRLCERAGKADLAIRLYRSGLRYNPNAFHLLERLSSVYASRLDFRSAFTAAIRILKKRKACGDYLRVGIYAVALRKLETAEKAFQAAISMNPHSWEAHYNLAELYMSARLMDQAREHYEAAVSHNLNRYEPLNGMGLFVLMVDNDWNRAIEFLCQAQEIAPSRPEPRLNLALAYSRKGDVTAAEEYTNSVLRLCQPGDPLYRQSERLKGMLRLEIHALRKLN
jgi:tetratricopeptide (TPR) repeat protein